MYFVASSQSSAIAELVLCDPSARLARRSGEQRTTGRRTDGSSSPKASSGNIYPPCGHMAASIETSRPVGCHMRSQLRWLEWWWCRCQGEGGGGGEGTVRGTSLAPGATSSRPYWPTLHNTVCATLCSDRFELCSALLSFHLFSASACCCCCCRQREKPSKRQNSGFPSKTLIRPDKRSHTLNLSECFKFA